LTAATGLLSVVLALVQVQAGLNLHLWGFNLLLIVWASLRQGLRGGVLVAGGSSICGLIAVSVLGGTIAQASPFQGVMLAQCSTALLVGASVGWIRASETRYRQIVGHIPAVLYSVRLPRPIAPLGKPGKGGLGTA